MPKFKVGDIVIANKLAKHYYGVTSPGWIGKVIAIPEEPESDDENIIVQSIKKEEDSTEYHVDDERFDLYEEAKPPVQEVKTKIPAASNLESILEALNPKPKLKKFEVTIKSLELQKVTLEAATLGEAEDIALTRYRAKELPNMTTPHVIVTREEITNLGTIS